jgi:hypothetical protein
MLGRKYRNKSAFGRSVALRGSSEDVRARFGLVGVIYAPRAASFASSHGASHRFAPFRMQIDEREADLQAVEVLGDIVFAEG